MMKLNEEGYQMIMNFEGLSLKPYMCSSSIPTIGFGNTFYPNGKKVTMRDKPITKEYAIEIFKFIADLFAKDVNNLLKTTVTQNQFNALVSFAYNVGSDIDVDDIPEGLGDSTLLKKVNKNPNDLSIMAEFLKWVRSNGEISKGLTTRRKKEAILYFKK